MRLRPKFGRFVVDRTLVAIRGCDAFLRTTRYDGDSISVREALALGTPVVASETGMRPDGIIPFPVGDAVALERAVGHALEARKRPLPASSEDGHANLDEVIAIYRELVK